MSFDQDPIEVHFCPPLGIKEKDKCQTNEHGVVEYYMDESQPSSRPYSMTEEYVLANPVKETNRDDIPEEIQPSRRQKPVVQDEYDEDNYCLARPSEDGSNSTRTEQKEDEEKMHTNASKENQGRCYLTTIKTIICVLVILLVVSLVGGGAAYFTLSNKGKDYELFNLRV